MKSSTNGWHKWQKRGVFLHNLVKKGVPTHNREIFLDGRGADLLQIRLVEPVFRFLVFGRWDFFCFGGIL
jgi:hypothetical protein